MDVSFQNGANFIHNLATIRTASGRLLQCGDLRRIAVADDLPRSLADLMIDLSIDDADFGATVERLARAAADFLEVRSAQVMIVSDYVLTLSQWWLGSIDVRRLPLREFTALEYLVARDTWVPVSPVDYWVNEKSDAFSVMLLDSFSRPELWQLQDCIRLRFTCGYNPVPNTGTGYPPDLDAPERLLTAWTMLTAHFYEHRELFSADKVAGQVEASAGNLLDSVRTFW